MRRWQVGDDGTAIGPTHAVELGGTTVVMTALWDDENGVGVSIDIDPDHVFYVDRFEPDAQDRIREMFDDLLTLKYPPTQTQPIK